MIKTIQAVDNDSIKQSFNLSTSDILVLSTLDVYDFDTELHTITPYFGAIGTRPITFADEIEKID